MSNNKIVNEEYILRTYPEDIRNRVNSYFNVVELRKRGLGPVKISRLTDVNIHTIRDWIYEGKIPIPVRAIEFLKKLRLLPLVLDTDDERLLLLVRIFGFMYGDGHIQKKSDRLLFYGEKNDLKNLKKDIKNLIGLSCKIERNGKDKSTYRLKLKGNGVACFTRLIIAMKAPIGNKVSQNYILPSWIMTAPNNVVKEFLGVILGNELCTPKLNKNGTIKQLKLTFNKTNDCIQSGMVLINQIRSLLKRFEIGTVEIPIKMSLEKRIDDKSSFLLGFRILNNQINFYKFYKNIKFLYAEKKQSMFGHSAKIIMNKLKQEAEKIDQYKKVLRLKELNPSIGRKRISRITGMDNYIPRIQNWLIGKKPRHLGKESLLKEITKNVN